MGVDLRRFKAGVSKQLLNNSKISSSIEQMRGKGVTKRVRMDRLVKSGIQDSSDVTRTKTITNPIEQHSVWRRVLLYKSVTALEEIAPNCIDCEVVEWKAALL